MTDPSDRSASGPNPRPDRTQSEPAARTDYPVTSASTEPAPKGKGTASAAGFGLSIFSIAVILGIIFLAVIIYFAVTR